MSGGHSADGDHRRLRRSSGAGPLPRNPPILLLSRQTSHLSGTPLSRTSFQPLIAALLAFALLLQVAAVSTGGVFCFGCDSAPARIRIADAPCTPSSNCCSTRASDEHTGDPATPDDHRDSHPTGCDCIDFKLEPSERWTAVRPTNPSEALAPVQTQIAVEASLGLSMPPAVSGAIRVSSAPVASRAVPQLLPSFRRTILQI